MSGVEAPRGEPEHDWWPPSGPETTHQRFRRILGTGFNTDRTVFFSDAVMAIAMTLLVLEIRVPEFDGSDRRFTEALLADAGQLYAFVLGFVLIAGSWVLHHRKFKLIVRYDAGLQLINLLFLFFIAILPVATAALAQSAQTATVVIYAFIIAGSWFTQGWLWVHARKAALFDSVVSRPIYRYVRDNHIPCVVIFLASIPLAILVDPIVALYFWILLFPVQIVFGRLGERRAARAEAALSRSRG